jgi:hypothetical protein
LIALIENAAAQAPHTTVKSPKRLVDPDTGQLREHDVVVTYARDRHVLVTAIECRDRSRKVGVPEVEAFHAKCMKTGVHREIIASGKGFCKTAIAKANQLAVGCMSVASAQSFNWCGLSHMTRHTRVMGHIATNAFTDGAPPIGGSLVTSTGVQLTLDQVKAIAVQVFEEWVDPAAFGVGRHRQTLRQEKPPLIARRPDGSETPVTHIDFKYDFEVVESLLPAKLQTYLDPVTGEVFRRGRDFCPPDRRTSTHARHRQGHRFHEANAVNAQSLKRNIVVLLPGVL